MVETTRKGDDFITLPLPQIAGQGAQAIWAAIAVYQQQAIVVDARLARKVRLGVKAIALSELCKQLSEETGIVLTTSPRVADDNVTLFCNPRPLRDIMRQLSAHFGFQWQREGQEGASVYRTAPFVQTGIWEPARCGGDQPDDGGEGDNRRCAGSIIQSDRQGYHWRLLHAALYAL